MKTATVFSRAQKSTVPASSVVVDSGDYADESLRIGDIVNYATHVRYQNVILGLEQRAEQLVGTVEAIDAKLNNGRGAPISCLGKSEEVAEAAVYLASDLPGITTGIDLKAESDLTSVPGYVPEIFQPDTKIILAE